MSEESSSRAAALGFLILALAVLGGIGLLLVTRPAPVQVTIYPPIPTNTPQPSPTPGPVLVYVTGAVKNPGAQHWLPHGSRVSDALEAAGGALEDADLERVNLAGVLRDGDQVHVPSQSGPQIAVATPGGGGLVYVNTATLQELMTLPDIGERTASNIIAYRETNGPFANLEALDAVPGIGTATLAKIKDLVAFD